MLRSPVDAEPFVTAGSRKVGDGGAEAVTVSSRVTPARNRNVLATRYCNCPKLYHYREITPFAFLFSPYHYSLLHSLSAQ